VTRSPSPAGIASETSNPAPAASKLHRALDQLLLGVLALALHAVAAELVARIAA